MKARMHTHPCSRCSSPAECWGAYERNHDGWPEAICSDYHLPGGSTADVLCEACADSGLLGGTATSITRRQSPRRKD